MAIARAIYNQADLIMMDEPTTALSLTETEKVFHFVRQVQAGGRSVMFIGHNIHHVFDIAERFVVMDRGTGRAAGDQGRSRHGRAADRIHAAAGAPRRGSSAAGHKETSQEGIELESDRARAKPRSRVRPTAPCGAFSSPTAPRSARSACSW